MMLTKIDFIKNLAVFSDFSWKNSLGNSENFKKLNIIYGRNYSGKTTLSRIIRAFEIGKLSDKYKNPEFQISTDESYKLTQNMISNKQNFRVFNSDFINENLSFTHDENGKIEPFAILGEDNQRILKEIEKIENELGNNSDEKTGLYKELEHKDKNNQESKAKLDEATNELDKALINKAKYLKETYKHFGLLNYDKKTLREDIKKVLETDFQPGEYDFEEKQKILTEETKEKIQKINIKFLLNELSLKTEELVEKKFETSSKIQELVENSLLNNWVANGLHLHKERKICAFCGNEITDNRIRDLKNHFDKEKEEFDLDIKDIKEKIENEKNNISQIPNNLFYMKFYSNFQNKAKETINELKHRVRLYNEELEKLLSQIIEKENDVFHYNTFVKPSISIMQDIKDFVNIYNDLVDKSNMFGDNLEKEKENTKQELLFNRVYGIMLEIGYKEKSKNIEELENISKLKNKELEEIKNIINTKELELKEYKAKLNDEQKGAEKVNIYLSNFFSHTSLKLNAVEADSESKKFHFEIQRDGKKAFNLSEGECRLISFAYFVAKLNDVDTKDTKPIIWIDDPICSLDSNHIFFIYSLIYDEIVMKDIFSQLFISTHNLEFFKYLKRLNTKEKNNKKYFLVENKNNISTIKIMPKYLEKYVTEFNYLFSEIYKCSKIEEPSDENYQSLYNFANNARKFMEIYLFYKFPYVADGQDRYEDEKKKMKLFFGDESLIPKILFDGIANEYSHLETGGIERGATPISVAEFRICAQRILNGIKKNDENQYKYFLKNIDNHE